jgi:uncharacterized SAM-binding protein YcdF (DUF218 family)
MWRIANRPQTEKPARRRWIRLVAVLLIVLGLSVASFENRGPPLLTRYALSFRVNHPRKSDAICILLGDFRVRPLRAAELYLRGFAPFVLIADYPEDMFYGSLESQLAQIITQRAGVPADRLIRIRGIVTSTEQEARFYRTYAEENQLQSLLIVTSSFHTRRSRWIFERVFEGSGIRLSFAAARQPYIDESNWFRSDEGLVTYFSETLKTVYYYIRY